MERKKENKNAPLLYNLAELQNDCARFFKISPDETLKVVQELYEKKLITYPRTDARVLSSAVAKEISKNLRGLQQYNICRGLADEILQGESWKKIGPPVIRMINRSLTTTQSFRPDRALAICGIFRSFPPKYTKRLSAVFLASSIRRPSIRRSRL